MIKKNRPVYLCGFMGCGKSTIGRLLAKKLGREFVDLDDYIVQREGMSIPEIFEQRGENYFREVETGALSELSAAAGVVAIDAPFDICYERIKGDKNRPIAYNSTREQLLDRYEQRKPLYKENSDFSVNGNAAPMQIVSDILY